MALTVLTLAGTMAFGPGNSTAAPRGAQAVLAEVGEVRILEGGDAICNLNMVEETCEEFEIFNCDPELPAGDTVRGTVAITAQPAPFFYGMVSLFSGEDGTSWWGNGQLPSGDFFVQELQAAGYMVAQVRWWVDEPGPTNSWLESHTDNDGEIGPQRMACRPATVIQDYLWEVVYKPIMGEVDAGGCGFCLSGNSGGATQISYSMVHYNLLDTQVDGMFPTSGPTHTKIDEGCLQTPGYQYFEAQAQMWIDASYAWNLGDFSGACSEEDPLGNWESVWNADSIENLGGDYDYRPNTRFEMIVSAKPEETPIRNHGCAYYGMVMAASKRFLTITGMPHKIQDSPAGLQTLYDAIVTGHSPPNACVPPIPPP